MLGSYDSSSAVLASRASNQRVKGVVLSRAEAAIKIVVTVTAYRPVPHVSLSVLPNLFVKLSPSFVVPQHVCPRSGKKGQAVHVACGSQPHPAAFTMAAAASPASSRQASMHLMPRVLGVASMKDLLLSLTAPLEANIGHIMAESYPGTQILCYLRYPVPIHANSCTMVFFGEWTAI